MSLKSQDLASFFFVFVLWNVQIWTVGRPENKSRVFLSFVACSHACRQLQSAQEQSYHHITCFTQVKPVWSLEGEQVSCLAADETTLELATGKPDGSITFWDSQTWTIKATLLSTTGAVSTIQYGRVKGSKLPATFVLVSLSSAWGVCSLVPSPCPNF